MAVLQSEFSQADKKGNYVIKGPELLVLYDNVFAGDSGW